MLYFPIVKSKIFKGEDFVQLYTYLDSVHYCPDKRAACPYTNV